MMHVQSSVDRTTPPPLRLSSIELFRAKQAGLAIAGAPTRIVWLSAVIAIVLISMVVVATVLWEHSSGLSSFLASPASSIREAWARAYGKSGEEFVILFLPLACTLFVLLSASTHLIDTHRTG